MSDIPIGTHIGPYQVETVLPGSRGGFARVVLARRISDGEKRELVAIKIARVDGSQETDSEIFARALGSEVETLRVLKHPGIVRLYPITLDNRRYSYIARASRLPGKPWYCVMEYLAGGTVEDLIRQQGRLEPALAVEIAHQVGVALDYIHTSGYAHLDVKTNNIMLRRPLEASVAPEAVLIDFGAAQKALRRAEVEAGALMYLPPERVQVLIGNRSPETVVNKAAVDVYALGVTLYRMLTGELPFRGRREHVTTAILHEAPTHPMEINRGLVSLPELDALIMEMLEKDPSRRPLIKEVLTRLDQAVMPPRFVSVSNVTISPGRVPQTWQYIALVFGMVAFLEAGSLFYLGLHRPNSTASSTPNATATPTLTVTAAPARQENIILSATSTRTKPSPQRTRTPTSTRKPTSTPSPGTLPKGPTVVPTYTPVPTRPSPTHTPVSPVPSPTTG